MAIHKKTGPDLEEGVGPQARLEEGDERRALQDGVQVAQRIDGGLGRRLVRRVFPLPARVPVAVARLCVDERKFAVVGAWKCFIIGIDVMITNFCDFLSIFCDFLPIFCDFLPNFCEKFGVFLITNVMVQILQKIAVAWTKKRHFCKNVWRKYFENHNIGPGLTRTIIAGLTRTVMVAILF
jgi:hypothetical protein